MSGIKSYLRGSEWNKWDLHFHTPTSYDYKDKGTTNEEIVQGLIDNEIRVVAITDHHIIDIERIKEITELSKGVITVLPGIEFLSESRAKDPIHFIAIFPEIDKCNIDYIWGQIQNKTAISKIYGEGKKVNEVYCNLNETIDLVHELGGIITIHAGGKHASVEGITNSLPHAIAQKTDIAHAVDIYELGKEEDQKGYKEKVFPIIKKQIPMIICSDNHKIKAYASKQNCWIKANPTFQGLKQIIFEPEDRVKIQEEKPEQKRDYEVIKSIKIIDSTGDFTSEKIYFNDNLNSIIGGKSSGKSLLLYLLAKTVLPLEKFEEISKYENFVNYDFDDIDCEVEWADGEITTLKTDVNKRFIEYIPQMFLNNIAEEKEKNISFKKTIDDLLYKQENYKENVGEVFKKVDDIKTRLNKEIEQYFTNKLELERLKIELSTLGDKKAIITSIKNYSDEIKILKEKSSLTEEDEKEMLRLTKDISTKEEEKKVIQKEISLNVSIIKLTDGLGKKIEDFIIDEFSSLESLEIHKTIIDDYKNSLSKELIQTIQKYKDSNPFDNDSLIKKIEETDDAINKLRDELKPYNEKISDQKKYVAIQKEESSETLKLNLILDKEKEIETQKLKLDTEKFINLYKDLFEEYKTIISLNEPYKNIGTDLELITNIDFNIEKFYDDFSYFITKNQSMDKIFSDLVFTEKNDFIYEKDSHINKITDILNKIFTIEVGFNQNKKLIDMTKSLLADYFEITYDLKQGHDLLNHMSPGKKGIILFQLFLEISSSKVPILIDQPEDNLDNRTVYETLNEFIKNKKIDRQIIMVSHNSNLVVSTDSENIIVANQNGESSSEKRFDYVNGALEETKEKDLSESNILKQQGIREHVCEILEGGIEAFQKREEKYNF